MTTYTLSATLAMPYDAAVAATRVALSDQGFGILTEIDLAATLKDKLGVELAPQVILGACRPALAQEALAIEPAIATVLPCNVVVRAIDENTSAVDAFDPRVMMGLTGSGALDHVAADARARLTAALTAITEED